MRWIAVALALIAGMAGCTAEPTSIHVDPPEGTSLAICPPVNSRAIAVDFRVNATDQAAGFSPGVHRLDARTFLWVWNNETETLREDRVSRVNPVQVARDAGGIVHVCTQVDIVTPTQVDRESRSLPVAIQITAREDLPAGVVQVTVNWIAGCPCDTLPRGNMTARFE